MERTIIFNRICTGDYLNEGSNLGHEIINLFKPDNKDYYYAYLMADGTYPSARKNDKVEAIYFTKAINSGCLEVVAVAMGITSVFTPCKNFKCFVGGGGDDEIKELFYDLLELNSLNQIKNDFSILEIDNLIDWLATESFLAMKPFDDSKKDELKKKSEELYSLANNIEEKFKDKQLNKLCKAIRRRAAHIEQLWYIMENDVRYGGVRVNELFDDNTSEQYGLSIYLTYKVNKIVKPSKPTYIIANETFCVESENIEVKNILVERDRLATTTLATFFYQNGKLTKTDKIKKENGIKVRAMKDGKLTTVRIPLTEEEKIEIIKKEKNSFQTLLENAEDIINNGQKLPSYETPLSQDDDFTFLKLIKKEYDELVFSNMFQYFFTHRDYKRLFIEFLKNEYNIQLTDSYIIKREQANIDLLIIDKNNVIVIENKIRSNINGIVLNEDGSIAQTQLEKYRKYVQKEFPNKKDNYFIFKPDYSLISKNELEGYEPIEYSKLATVFKKGLSIKVDKATEIYFSDFVKSLEMHAIKTDNHYEEIMRKRMQGIIDIKVNLSNGKKF